VVLVTLVAAAFRLWGIFHGFREGYLYHLDARFVVHSAWHHLLGGTWLHGRFGAVYGAMMWAALWVVDALGRFAGYPFAWTFEGIAAVASLLGATLGTATVPLVYLLGARAYGRATGVLAATLLAVSPLHAFQSHYPYRDVPMLFLLTLSLIASVAVVQHPTLPRVAVAGAAAVLTAAAKPAGALAFPPLALAIGLALPRGRRWRLLAGAGGVVLLAGLALPLIAPRTVRSALAFARRATLAGLAETAARHLDTFVTWVGVPFVIATALAVACALWRRRRADWVLLALFLPAAASIARFRFSDERFHLLLLPAATVLVGRLVADAWDGARPRSLLRGAVALAAAGLVITGAGRSAWLGHLLSLPDTRAIAGGWFDAHVPRDTRIKIEEYYPLGVNEWPRARHLDPRQPLSAELAEADLVVTSSVEHERYFESTRLFPREAAFLAELPRQARLVKRVAIEPLGFLHPDIAVFSTRPPGAAAPARLLLPRPYDHRWNHGVASLDPGPYDRDDRTVWLGGAQRQLLILAGPEPVEEVLAIVLNGPSPAALRIDVGWRHWQGRLEPGEWRTIRLRPRWRLPYRPALYRAQLALLPEGSWALVQLRAGPREIGEGLGSWGRWEAAVPYLERAVATAGAADLDTALLLASAYRHVGRPDAARVVLAREATRFPARLDAYRRIADPALTAAEWERAFAAGTGLDAGWLGDALAQEFEAEDLVLKAGRHLADRDASSDRSVVFDRARNAAGVLVNGPHVFHQPPGAYRARVRLRAWDPVPRPGAVAVVRIFGESRLLGERAVRWEDVAPDGTYAEVVLPYAHPDPRVRVAVQVEATGAASLAVDRVRFTPDLRATLRAHLAPVLALLP
jgi:hypothetical protein